MPGEVMGLKALLSGNPHSVSATAFEDSSVCMISKSDFFHFMIKYPGFNQSIILFLSKLLDDAEKRMLSLAFKPVRERLAETLIFLFTSFYPGIKTSSENYLNLSRMDLANIIGTAQETIIRLLSEFREAELIKIKGRKIFLLDMVKLTSIANQKG
jgi:CRP-like cAMP-binding protein